MVVVLLEIKKETKSKFSTPVVDIKYMLQSDVMICANSCVITNKTTLILKADAVK